MATLEQTSLNSSSAVNSYVNGFNTPRSVNNVVQMVYGMRRERRRLLRALTSLQKTLEDFKEHTVGFLKASKGYLEVISDIPYPVLVNSELLSKKALSEVDVQVNALKQLKSKSKLPIIDEILNELSELLEINDEIHKQSGQLISFHSPIDALERGYILISDLDDENLSLEINFKINLSKEDDEIRGEIEVLDIIVYEESIKDVTASSKEYIKEIYFELLNSKNSELSSRMKFQKELLTNFVLKS